MKRDLLISGVVAIVAAGAVLVLASHVPVATEYLVWCIVLGASAGGGVHNPNGVVVLLALLAPPFVLVLAVQRVWRRVRS